MSSPSIDDERILELLVQERTCELEIANQSLLEMIDDLRVTEEALKKARDDAEKANIVKSQFLANMSHELRTPMHGILSFAALGMEKCGSAPTEKIMRYFSRIHESGQRLLHLLNDLLDLSKMEAGRMEYQLEQHRLADLVETVLEELDGLLQEKALTAEVSSDMEDSTVVCDRERILQVVRNLLSNAIKFSPAGGTIRITLSETKLPEGRRATDPHIVPAVLCTVRDQGVGIPEEELESIFDKFTQSSKTRSGSGGTGLGLAICREIIRAHLGDIKAFPASGAPGAVVGFSLPRRNIVFNKKKRLGEVLIEQGHITEEQLRQALISQSDHR
ncbi:MAG: ATP-binding protein [Thermodesulfobacteriota bacterium]